MANHMEKLYIIQDFTYALMHRSYRENRPTQIIRYDNRIEIINPGFSLKSEEMLGEPGSETRNPFIAAVFHETNLAETKGSGIRSMRKLMERSHLAPPTFESSRDSNHFVARLLLHHFLNEEDIAWLSIFSEFQLNDNQKKALVFVRETEAIDNQTYRQISGADVLKSSSDLRKLRDDDLLDAKGKGRATYYVPGKKFTSLDFAFNNQSVPVTVDSAPVTVDSAPVTMDSAPVTVDSLRDELPEDLAIKIDNLKRRLTPEEVQELIHELCKIRPYRLAELCILIDRSPKYVLRKFIQPIMNIRIEYLYKDMVNHPNQAYVSI
jgi:ATP-dependent DNA helicase RecG